MKKLYAISPINKGGRLTKGKAYPVTSKHPEGINPDSFYAYLENGHHAFCLAKGCGHLDGGNWSFEWREVETFTVVTEVVTVTQKNTTIYARSMEEALTQVEGQEVISITKEK